MANNQLIIKEYNLWGNVNVSGEPQTIDVNNTENVFTDYTYLTGIQGGPVDMSSAVISFSKDYKNAILTNVAPVFDGTKSYVFSVTVGWNSFSSGEQTYTLFYNVTHYVTRLNGTDIYGTINIFYSFILPSLNDILSKVSATFLRSPVPVPYSIMYQKPDDITYAPFVANTQYKYISGAAKDDYNYTKTISSNGIPSTRINVVSNSTFAKGSMNVVAICVIEGVIYMIPLFDEGSGVVVLSYVPATQDWNVDYYGVVNKRDFFINSVLNDTNNILAKGFIGFYSYDILNLSNNYFKLTVVLPDYTYSVISFILDNAMNLTGISLPHIDTVYVYGNNNAIKVMNQNNYYNYLCGSTINNMRIPTYLYTGSLGILLDKLYLIIYNLYERKWEKIGEGTELQYNQQAAIAANIQRNINFETNLKNTEISAGYNKQLIWNNQTKANVNLSLDMANNAANATTMSASAANPFSFLLGEEGTKVNAVTNSLFNVAKDTNNIVFNNLNAAVYQQINANKIAQVNRVNEKNRALIEYNNRFDVTSNIVNTLKYLSIGEWKSVTERVNTRTNDGIYIYPTANNECWVKLNHDIITKGFYNRYGYDTYNNLFSNASYVFKDINNLIVQHDKPVIYHISNVEIIWYKLWNIIWTKMSETNVGNFFGVIFKNDIKKMFVDGFAYYPTFATMNDILDTYFEITIPEAPVE